MLAKLGYYRLGSHLSYAYEQSARQIFEYCLYRRRLDHLDAAYAELLSKSSILGNFTRQFYVFAHADGWKNTDGSHYQTAAAVNANYAISVFRVGIDYV